MTLCSLTRYNNLKRGIPRRKTKKELWRGRYVVTRKTYRKRGVLYFFSLSSLSSFFLLAAAVSAGLRRVFCRKQKQPVRTSGIRDTFPIFHRLVCVILLDNSSMRDRRLYIVQLQVSIRFLFPIVALFLFFFFFFFTRSLYIIAHTRNGVRLVNRNRGVSKVSKTP